MAIGDALAQVWALPSSEIWTALEITGTATDLRVAVACAIRSDDKPEAIAGGTPLNGRHRAALDALSLLSVAERGAGAAWGRLAGTVAVAGRSR